MPVGHFNVTEYKGQSVVEPWSRLLVFQMTDITRGRLTLHPMSSTDQLSDIASPIAGDLVAFEKHFREAVRSDAALLDKIMHYIVRRKGKKVRPMLVFLSARLYGPVTDPVHVAASLVELLHTATLVHDDVVDSSFYRRGFFSVNALWGNKGAVLVGDYLLSRGLLLALDNNEYKLLQILSRAVRDMSEGELLQIKKARNLDITEAVYFDIIRQKTASLMAASCAAGASAAGASEDEVERMRQFGEYIGIAFQIKDDLLDFGEEDTGKPKGIDIKEKKMTLPLIHALTRADEKDRRHMMQTIRKYNTDSARVAELIRSIHNLGGVEYARGKMRMYQQMAVDLLADMPHSDARASLERLVDFVVTRKK